MTTHAQQYASAWYPDQWRVLGQSLEPMTLGHALLLTRLGNRFAPFSGASDAVTLAEFLQGVWICSRSAASAATGLQRRRTGWVWRGWQRWFLAMRPESRAIALVAWRSYLEDQTRLPRIWIKSDAQARQAPVLQTLVSFALEHLGSRMDTVLDFRLRLVLEHMAAWAEGHGTVEFVSEEDADLLASSQQRGDSQQPEREHGDKHRVQEQAQRQRDHADSQSRDRDSESKQGDPHGAHNARTSSGLPV